MFIFRVIFKEFCKHMLEKNLFLKFQEILAWKMFSFSFFPKKILAMLHIGLKIENKLQYYDGNLRNKNIWKCTVWEAKLSTPIIHIRRRLISLPHTVLELILWFFTKDHSNKVTLVDEFGGQISLQKLWKSVKHMAFGPFHWIKRIFSEILAWCQI